MRNKTILATLGSLVIAAPLAFTVAQIPAAHAQILHADGPLPTFEVATVRPWLPPPPPPPPPSADAAVLSARKFPEKIAPGRGGAQTSDRVHMTFTAQQLIASAYNLPFGFEGRVEGGPDWVRQYSNQYDIQAKIDDSTFAAMQKLQPSRQRDQVELMEQSLLADRFHLKVHFETREVPAYALVISKGGAKLTPAKDAEITRLSMLSNTITATAIDLDQWIHSPFLSRRVIVDQTGLTGKYDFALTFADRINIEAEDPTGGAPSLFTAVQQQLGLKHVPTKAPVEILIIDHIEKPSAN